MNQNEVNEGKNSLNREYEYVKCKKERLTKLEPRGSYLGNRVKGSQMLFDAKTEEEFFISCFKLWLDFEDKFWREEDTTSLDCRVVDFCVDVLEESGCVVGEHIDISDLYVLIHPNLGVIAYTEGSTLGTDANKLAELKSCDIDEDFHKVF